MTSPVPAQAILPPAVVSAPSGSAPQTGTPTPAAAPPPPAGTPGTAPAGPAGDAQSGASIVGPPGSNPVLVRIVALNDFHGQIGDSSSIVEGDAIGGAATLAAYVNKERAGNPNGTVVVSAGDAFGASPPESTLLNHESSMAVLAAMGLNVATIGNHETDSGLTELLRLIRGGKRAGKKGGTKGGPTWPGSPFPWVSANIINTKTGKPLLRPYVIMKVNGVKVAFIGAVTKDLYKLTSQKGIAGIKVLDPAVAINRYIPEIRKQGVKAIVAFMHEGGEFNKKSQKLSGPIVDIATRLHPEVDAVVSAHSHQTYSTRVAGKIVTQAGSYAKALASIDLLIDPKTGQVVNSTSRIVRNKEKGIAPDPLVGELVNLFERSVAPRTKKIISRLPGAVNREPSKAGETALGTLVAEAQRRAAKADVALMNPGGIRQDIPHGGAVSWGELYSVQPFGNRVLKLSMTGKQLLATLEQIFRPAGEETMILQVAGMRVWFDTRKPIGQRIAKVVMDDGKPLDLKRRYTVAANEFIADGGDGFTELTKATRLAEIGDDMSVLVNYLASGAPVPIKPIGRLNLVPGAPAADYHN